MNLLVLGVFADLSIQLIKGAFQSHGHPIDVPQMAFLLQACEEICQLLFLLFGLGFSGSDLLDSRPQRLRDVGLITTGFRQSVRKEFGISLLNHWS